MVRYLAINTSHPDNFVILLKFRESDLIRLCHLINKPDKPTQSKTDHYIYILIKSHKIHNMIFWILKCAKYEFEVV